MKIKNKKRKFGIFLLILISIFSINLISANLYYDVNLNYNKGDIKINSVNIEFSNYELGESANERFFLVYSSKISDKDKVLDETFFNIPNKQYSDNYDNKTDRIVSGGVEELEEVDFNINLPYYENAKEIVIYNEKNEEIARKSLIEFSKDFSKQDYENIIIKTGEEIVNNEISDIEDESDEIEDSEEEIKNYTIPLIIGLLVILIIVIIYVVNKNKKK